jgi:molybdopterin biosynthesis enzyme
MLGGLAKANCLVMLSEEKDRIEKGETVVIRFLSWMKR